MPQIVKQVPNGRLAPAKAKVGSLLSAAVPAEQMGDDAIHMLLYGKNRIGKTTFACQFPKPLLLLSLEATGTGGAKSIRKVPGVEVIQVKAETGRGAVRISERIEGIGKELAAGGHRYKTVVIDSGTSLEELVLAEVCGWEERAKMIAVGTTRPGAKVTMDQYTERSERMRKIISPFTSLPIHLILICNEKDHNPPESRKSSLVRGLETESYFAAAMGAGTTRWAQDACDCICQLYMDKETKVTETIINKQKIRQEVETGKLVRRLRTGYHINFAAGMRSENPEQVPEFIEANTPQEMYQKLMKVLGIPSK